MTLHPAVVQRLERLAPDQRAAATAPRGPVLCIAPAGSGKTTTLVARIAWLVASGGDPAAITAVTFNRRAAAELRRRLAEALAPLESDPRRQPRVRTFHALGREILEDAGVDVSRLVDREKLLCELAGAALPPAELRLLDDAFSRLKLDLCLEAEMLREDATPALEEGIGADALAAFLAYERALLARGALDFDDLVRLALAVVADDDDLLARWRSRCRPLLVDEVQDVDRTQLRLALLLAAPEMDVFLVGDDDQTIYGWRLADVRRVLRLAAGVPGIRRVDLTVNYRCPPMVVERAVRLVERNAERFAKTIRAADDSHGSLVLAPDPGDEVGRARRVVDSWALAADSLDRSTYAVLARTNAELAPYAAVALESAIPYRVDEDGLLLGDPALDVVLDALDRAAATSPDLPLLVLLGRIRAAAPSEHQPIAGGLLAWAPRHANAADLRAAVVDARQRRGRLRRDDANLVLATAHGTKGLEFDLVCCVGMDNGVFPNTRSLEESVEPARSLEEERRLAYVAWTRARRSLLLLYDPFAPSPFMREAFDEAELAA